MSKPALTNLCGPERTALNVVQWGYDKGILNVYTLRELPNARQAQANKTLEEVTELFQAIHTYNREEALDAIGDIIVTLIMQADLWDTDIFVCLDSAYDTIRKRTGKMVDGQFVKDS